MEKTDGEPRGSAGQECPALPKLQESEKKNAVSGEVAKVFRVTPEKFAAVQELLGGGAELPMAGCGLPVKKSFGEHCRAAGASCAVVLMLTAATGGDFPSTDKGPRPECEVRAERCVHRLPEGLCRRTARACRLFAEGHRETPAILEPQILQEVLAHRRLLDGLVHGQKKLLAMNAELLADGQSSKQRGKNSTANGMQGRLRWENGFAEVWLSGQHYDLTGRNKARFCLQYLVAKRAFDGESARHLETEIDPFVRKKCQLPPLPASAQSNLRIQHFFKDPARKLNRLRRELVKAAGRNGRCYLEVG